MALLSRRKKMGAETRDKAVTIILRSSTIEKARPSQKWRKCLIAACAANNSQSTWSNETQCPSTFWKRNKVVANSQ
jgi:hypothetical protein